ncbi:unnamed protein product, partial [Tetraodon nigroviridis]
CPSQADVAFLLDGSGSVNPSDFDRMKTFVSTLVRSFKGRDTKFAIVQFATIFRIESSFTDQSNLERNINNIVQFKAGTNTASAINFVVNNVFVASGGSRENVGKVLIVITDGKSNNKSKLPGAARAADAKRIVRFAIGV